MDFGVMQTGFDPPRLNSIINHDIWIDTILNKVFGFIFPDDLIPRKVNRKLLFVDP